MNNEITLNLQAQAECTQSPEYIQQMSVNPNSGNYKVWDRLIDINISNIDYQRL